MIEQLHSEIHRAYQLRNLDKRSHRVWEEACKKFHGYVSLLDAYLERACSEAKYSDIELIEFAVCFLELDAWFFRSGYLKQILIARLNRSELKEEIKQRLRWVLMKVGRGVTQHSVRGMSNVGLWRTVAIVQ